MNDVARNYATPIIVELSQQPDMQFSRPLRICGVVPVYCHPEWRGGGVARTATDLLSALARRGNQVTVISPLFDGNHRFDVPSQVTFYEGRLRFVYAPAAHPTRFGTSSDNLAALLSPLLSQVDVVHIHSFMSPWTDVAASLARRRGVCYVIQDHGKLTPSISSNRAIPKRLYLALRGLGLLRSASRIVPSAENVAECLRRWDPQLKCESCTNGLDPAEFGGSVGDRPLASPYVLFLGWLDPRKNVDLLMRAFAKVARETEPWKLALVGPDSYSQSGSLLRLAEKLGINDRVVMPGMVRGDAKLAWLRHAGLFVLPSTGEGLSLAMIEALACGLPCLLSAGCNYPAIESAKAGQVLPITESAWSDGLRNWIQDSRAREQAGRQARKLFEDHHTIEKVGESLESLLYRAVSESTGTQV